MQLTLLRNVNVPTDTSGWLTIFNRTGVLAPGGGAAFRSGSADNTSGALGVSASGIFPLSVVVISLPSYEGLVGESVPISSADVK